MKKKKEKKGRKRAEKGNTNSHSHNSLREKTDQKARRVLSAAQGWPGPWALVPHPTLLEHARASVAPWLAVLLSPRHQRWLCSAVRCAMNPLSALTTGQLWFRSFPIESWNWATRQCPRGEIDCQGRCHTRCLFPNGLKVSHVIEQMPSHFDLNAPYSLPSVQIVRTHKPLGCNPYKENMTDIHNPNFRELEI